MFRLARPHVLAGLSLLFALALGGCRKGADPFSYVRISGTIAYEDGSKITLAPDTMLTFLPETPPMDNKTYPRAGMVMVDPATGKFRNATTLKANDGLVRGKHKVTITHLDRSPLPANVVPPEYGDYKQTPLEVDTSQQPFQIKVRKP
jgi:hypothetical protein